MKIRPGLLAIPAALWASGAGATGPGVPALERDAVPASMRACFACHRAIVTEYVRTHGMARSVGPAGPPGGGTVVNPKSGTRYEISADGERLTATFPDGGRRVQRLVGRIGAGIFDTSWVGAEVDVATGADTGRLFFAPVETIAGHGLELSPFELEEGSAGLDLALTEGCLTCHTDSDPARLPGAATAGSGETARVYPANALGAGAFGELRAVACDGCHGDPSAHLAVVSGQAGSLPGDLGLPSLAELAPGEQRDVCARCHLQGDARIDLAGARPSPGGRPPGGRPLAGQVPVLVPKTPPDAAPSDDFRFVGQLERLALSACFRGASEMTCTTCHLPHRGVRLQGTASFDRTCAACHPCAQDPGVTTQEVTGSPARTADGCVDCHVRRSQPFDLPHVRSADHFIRRRIPRPQDDVPHRQFADREGPLEIYDDGRLASLLATPGGRRWRSGVHAMGLLTLGRIDEAARRFEAFPPPGTAAARAPSAPGGLAALETLGAFHQTRALVLLATGRFDAAHAAFSDALALDPADPGARMGRARLRLDAGDVAGAILDTQQVIDRYPRAEQPWKLRAEIAERLGRPELALEAYDAATRLWPSDAAAWARLGLLLRQRGDADRARAALERARILQPSLELAGGGSASQ